MTNQVKTSAPAAAKPTKKKKIASLDKRKARAGWLFVLPFLIGLAIIYIPIIYESIKQTLFVYQAQGGGVDIKTFVGFANYREVLFGQNATFLETLLTGLKDMAFDIPAILIFSLFVAVILNQKMVGRAAFRAIFFLPVIVTTGMMSSIMTASYSSSAETVDLGGAATTSADRVASAMAVEALLERIFSSLGFGLGLVQYIAKAVASIANIINRSGVQILIFLASLQSISPAIYESCQIDGATSWETFWKVTFPMVSPMILVNAVYTIIDSFTVDSNVVMRAIDQTYLNSSQHQSAAMGWMYFLVVLLIVGIVAGIISAYVFYQRRD